MFDLFSIVLPPSPHFAFTASQGGAACPAPLGDPPGHPATRPCGFAALLGLAGAGRTRRYAPQTGCRPLSCQSCATRPRKRDEPRCTLDHSSILRLTALEYALVAFPRADSMNHKKAQPGNPGWAFSLQQSNQILKRRTSSSICRPRLARC